MGIVLADDRRKPPFSSRQNSHDEPSPWLKHRKLFGERFEYIEPQCFTADADAIENFCERVVAEWSGFTVASHIGHQRRVPDMERVVNGRQRCESAGRAGCGRRTAV